MDEKNRTTEETAKQAEGSTCASPAQADCLRFGEPPGPHGSIGAAEVDARVQALLEKELAARAQSSDAPPCGPAPADVPLPPDVSGETRTVHGPGMTITGPAECFAKPGERKPRRIAIVGSASSRIEAPYHDSTWEIWGINDEWRWMPRWDKLFELHDPEKFKGPSKPERHQWLRDYKGPNELIMQKVHDDIPQSVAYPLDRMREKYRVDEARDIYCNNTISYLMFYALDQMQAGDELGLWGVDMATWLQDCEYGHQRPSCEYCLGIATGMGVKVTLARNSDLLTCRVLYGFGIETGDQEQLDEKRRVGLSGKQEELNRSLQDAEARFHAFKHSNRVEHAAFGGALEQLIYSRQGDQK